MYISTPNFAKICTTVLKISYFFDFQDDGRQTTSVYESSSQNVTPAAKSAIYDCPVVWYWLLRGGGSFGNNGLYSQNNWGTRDFLPYFTPP